MDEFDPQEKTRIVDSGPDESLSADNAGFQITPNQPGTIGRYHIIGLLGRGGFGTVYLADDKKLGRQVAVKVPNRDLRKDDAESYLKEARMVAALDHSNIVPVYDVGSTPDFVLFIVSKYVKGITLRKHIQQQRLTYAEICQLVSTIAEALHYAHKQGIVHRDIKPANILISSDQRPFIVDFGLALREADAGSGPVSAGTPAYMSPEQARGEGHRVDGRSDIFSLGVVFYQMLSGQKPFRGNNHSDILTQVEFHDPKPLRQYDELIPRELERICNRAMEKRASERYSNAKDLAEDLEHFLDQPQNESLSRSASASATQPTTPLPQSATAETPIAGGSTDPGLRISTTSDHSEQQLQIVPKGLRSFDSHDADFFLRLLPGPRDRDGLPDALRFWKTQIDAMDSEKTFSVGLIYGPSGCGKSSFVKAALLPRLGPQVTCLYVESAQQETETRLLREIRKACPDVPRDFSLKQALTEIRRGRFLLPSQKLLIVLDQFEQWLHAPRDLAEAELVHALRQCDGGRVQCVVMVRDDFWMSVARFMRALEIRLLEGQNSAVVDLFDVVHAERVLRAFGRAFGRLPESRADFTSDQKLFLKTAISGLANEGRIICVRLAVFAEMMKSRAWTPATLREVGGAQGLGVNFLEETFNGLSAPPERRYHQAAARAVLRCLLPDSGSDMKGHMRSEQELMEVCGYAGRKADFDELISILDGSLRLISPIDATEPASGEDSRIGRSVKSYQLAHDYLVASIRDWLTRKQQETLRGRAELLLAQRSEMWNGRQEAKQLPSFIEWLKISFWTRRANRTDAEQAMMRTAHFRHGRNLLFSMMTVAIIAVGVMFANDLMNRQRIEDRAVARVDALIAADETKVPEIIAELRDPENRDQVQYTIPLLHQVTEDPKQGPRGRFHASLALLEHDSTQKTFLLEHALSPESQPREVRLVCDTLSSQDVDIAAELWRVVEKDAAVSDEKFRALCMLAHLDTAHARWNDGFLNSFAARELINQRSISSALMWSEILRPVKHALIDPLTGLFNDSKLSDTRRSVVANILVDYGQSDPELLTSLVVDATPQQFDVLTPALKQNQTRSQVLLRERLTKQSLVEWPDENIDGPPADAAVVEVVQQAAGAVADQFAFCQTMPLEDFKDVAAKMGRCHYRPTCFRPYENQGAVLVAAIWERDQLPWKINYGTTVKELRAQDAEFRQKSFWPVDVAHYRTVSKHDESSNLFAAVWSARWNGVNDAAMYVGVPEEAHEQAWAPFVNDNFSIRTNLKTRDANGNALYSSVRWRQWHLPKQDDAWNDDLSDYLARSKNGWTQRDVRLNLDFGNGDVPVYSAAWWDGSTFETQERHGLSIDDHLTESADLQALGYRPWSISIVAPSGKPQVSAVWARPIVEEQIDRTASENANAAIALIHLDASEELWPLLRQAEDPRLRAILINRLAALNCPIRILTDRLSTESDASIRRAILLSLTEYELADVPADRQSFVTKTLSELFEFDPDPGVHSAADLLLRRWQLDNHRRDLLAGIPKEIDQQRRWFTNMKGHSFSVFRGGKVFTMGSRPHTNGRNNYRETLHQRNIPRNFAVGTREVTVRQFLRFQPDFSYPDDLTRSPDCPITSVSWIDAAKYCRWLSEQEKIPEDQMCFPPIPEIEAGEAASAAAREAGERIPPVLTLPEDYLSRTGYRLPTEAEWEFVCRAGTTTERYFGQTDLLIDKHAWTIETAQIDGQYRSWPVAQLRPNDFGAFDMLGNVMEWCMNQDPDYPNVAAGTVVTDEEEQRDIYANGGQSLRGGSYLYQFSNARAGHRDNAHGAGNRFPYMGFRIAKTVSPHE